MCLICSHLDSVAKLHNLIAGKQRASGESMNAACEANINVVVVVVVVSIEEEVPKGREVSVAITPSHCDVMWCDVGVMRCDVV